MIHRYVDPVIAGYFVTMFYIYMDSPILRYAAIRIQSYSDTMLCWYADPEIDCSISLHS